MLEELVEEYLLVCESKGHTKTTLEHNKTILNQFVRFVGDDTVNPLLARKWIIHLQNLGNKPKTVNSKLIIVRTFYKWCVEEEIFESNPFGRIKMLKAHPPVIKAYTRSDINKMLNYYKGNNFMPVRNKTLITFLVETGVRNSELRNVKLEDIGDNAIRIWGKGNKVRYVPISKTLRMQLMKYLRIRKEYMEGTKDCGLLFVSRLRRPVTRFALLKLIKEMGEALEIDVAKSIHNFRRFYAQTMLKNTDLYTVSKLLGHSSIKTTETYLLGIANDDVLENGADNSPLSN